MSKLSIKQGLLFLTAALLAVVPGANSRRLLASAVIAPAIAISVPQPPVLPRSTNKACGIATYYDLSGITANGETFDPKALTAAHPSLPFDSVIKVVDQHTQRSVQVRINDRGPWMHGYMLDLTPAAMNTIDPKRTSDLREVCIYW